MAKPPNESSQNVPDHIDQIRDIILGPQKRRNDQRFEEIVAELDRFQEESRTSARKLLDELHEEGARLQKLIDQSQSLVRTELSSKIQQLETSLSSVQEELAGTKTKHRSEMVLLKEHFREELQQRVADLRDTNVSREAMADLLQELAAKLKGVKILEELTNAVGRKSGR